ncbi:MAG: Flp family type IVb pilin [Polyangiales bacterium]
MFDAMLADRIRHTRRRLVGDTRGANLVEYIILVGVIALIAIAGFKVFGGQVRAKVDEQSGSVEGINGAAK